MTNRESSVEANLRKPIANGVPYAESTFPELQLRPQHVMLTTIPARKSVSDEYRCFMKRIERIPGGKLKKD